MTLFSNHRDQESEMQPNLSPINAKRNDIGGDKERTTCRWSAIILDHQCHDSFATLLSFVRLIIKGPLRQY
jgi:hypothetical protein